jgi:hypothetical protein
MESLLTIMRPLDPPSPRLRWITFCIHPRPSGRGFLRRRVKAEVLDTMSMNLKKVMIELGIPDVEKILRIDMDDDPALALEFVKEVLAKRVKESLQPH